jgi:hypothetical protein
MAITELALQKLEHAIELLFDPGITDEKCLRVMRDAKLSLGVTDETD